MPSMGREKVLQIYRNILDLHNNKIFYDHIISLDLMEYHKSAEKRNLCLIIFPGYIWKKWWFCFVCFFVVFKVYLIYVNWMNLEK